jgi:hypothetical protein
VSHGKILAKLSVSVFSGLSLSYPGYLSRRLDAYASRVTDSSPRQGLPVALRFGAGLVAVEAAALIALAVVELSSLDPARLGLGLTTTAFFLLYAVALAACALGLWYGKRWSRSPVVLTQLIGLGVAWSFASGSTWVAAVLGSLAIATLVCVFLPASTEALTSTPSEP